MATASCVCATAGLSADPFFPPWYFHRVVINLPVLTFFFSFAVGLPAAAPGNFANLEAVREVLAGKRGAANAAWWGFQPEDSTTGPCL